MHIFMWERPNLNKQLEHYNVSLSVELSFFSRWFHSSFPLVYSNVKFLLYSTEELEYICMYVCMYVCMYL